MTSELNGKRVAILAADGNLITSRSPDDLPAFCNAIVEAFSRVGASAGGAR